MTSTETLRMPQIRARFPRPQPTTSMTKMWRLKRANLKEKPELRQIARIPGKVQSPLFLALLVQAKSLEAPVGNSLTSTRVAPRGKRITRLHWLSRQMAACIWTRATCTISDFLPPWLDNNFLITLVAPIISSCTPVSSAWEARFPTWRPVWVRYWRPCLPEEWPAWTRPAWGHRREHLECLLIYSNTSWRPR